MPGNEVGDRVHNFFGQENLSQGQHHSQTIDGNWQGLNNNLWVGGQRQIGSPFNSNLKNYNVQQPADSERGHGSQSLQMPHGLNFAQSNLKPEFGRVQAQNQQPALNGYVHGHQIFQTRQNEANFLGVDTETDRHNLTARSLPVIESHQGNGPEQNKRNSMRLEASDSPVSFDFFGGQQQMSGQQLNMLQSLSRQQSGINDVQLLQRHMILSQIQELQRQQQLQQLDARHGFTNQVPTIVKQAAGNHSPSLINGVPVNEAPNNLWQPEFVTGNANWLQRGASPVMPGLSSGHMLPPEQGQALRLMDMVPQQADQSLYGVPISSTSGTSGPYSHIQMDKPPMQQISVNSNSLSGNPYAAFPGQVSMQDGSRQDFHGKSTLGPATDHGLGSGFNLENLQSVNPQQRNEPMQGFLGRQELGESSEPPQEKAFMQVTASQGSAALDPTEEKILYGSDDNIWEAFGKSPNMGMGGLMLDNTDCLSGYPPVQSGSWSALMQSAVAETSSGDVGIQEEWCGPTFKNPEAPAGNQQPSTASDGGKQQGVWDDKSFQPAAAPNSRQSPLSVDANSISNPQLQQSGFKTSHVQGDMLQTDSSQRFVPQFSEQGSKWSDRGHFQRPFAEGNHIYSNVGHSSGIETNMNNNSGSQTHQQTTSSHNSDGQPYTKPNGWNFIESKSADGGNKFKSPENKSAIQSAQGSDGKRGMHEETGHVSGTWRVNSIPNSNVELEHAKSSMGSPRVGRDGSSMNNVNVPNSSSMRLNQESKQQPPNSHKFDFWKVVDPSVNSKGGEVMGKNQQNPDNSLQILESSENSGMGVGAVEMLDADKFKQNDNSSDSFRSSAPYHASAGSPKDNVWSDAGDSRTFSGGKQKSSGNVGRRPPGTRKFQYHPMGDVDVDSEPSYGTKHVTNTQTMSQQVSRGFKVHDQGNFGQSKLAGHTDKSSVETEKGHLLGGQGDSEGLDATPSKTMFPGFVPNASAPFDRSIDNYAPNKAPSSSQHMLELLHKVDHPRERGTTSHFSSSDRNMASEMPEAETSDGSVGHIQRNQLSNSQGFGLQLAPPSQRLPNAETVVYSSSQIMGSHEKGERSDSLLASAASPSSHEPSQVLRNNIQGSYSTPFPSGFPYPRNIENQRTPVASGQAMANHVSSSQNNLATSTEVSPLSSTNQMHSRDATQQILESGMSSIRPGISQQGAFPKPLPNAWTSVPHQQPFPGSQSSKSASSLFRTQLQSNNHLATMSPPPPKLNEQDKTEGRNGPSGFGAVSANSQSLVGKEQPANESPGQQASPDNVDPAQKTLSQGQESAGNNFSEASLENHAATQRDIEAFGRSLRPNNSLHQNYSLLHQVQVMKSDIDTSDRSAKRLKGPDYGVDPQQVGPRGVSSYGYNSMVRDSSASHTSVPSGDSKLLHFSSKPGDTRDSNPSSQDMFAFGRNNSQNFPSTSSVPLSSQHNQISPQMAPSWFDQYGTLKNGQILPAHDMRRMKSMEQPLMIGQPVDDLRTQDSIERGSADVDSSRLANILQGSAATSVASESFASPHLLPPDVTDQSLVVVRPKKRKTATSDLLPWYKELLKVSQRLPSISMAEADWARATNRLPEKVEDEVEILEDVPPMLRSRRRFILTTQLMQQLLCPPPAVLSSDAISQYESVAYFVARVALGDACSATSSSRSDSSLPLDSQNLLSEKIQTHERIVDQHFSKVVEDFVGRAIKLENDLSRLDKRASILDLRVECQDLEKFSVINRFAKFHGKGQADGAETSLSDGTPNAQKSFPQRYVTALPMPRNLPDRVQCLSL
ncbi:hypothetical protein UlMin_008373 [Ulmus minor]